MDEIEQLQDLKRSLESKIIDLKRQCIVATTQLKDTEKTLQGVLTNIQKREATIAQLETATVQLEEESTRLTNNLFQANLDHLNAHIGVQEEATKLLEETLAQVERAKEDCQTLLIKEQAINVQLDTREAQLLAKAAELTAYNHEIGLREERLIARKQHLDNESKHIESQQQSLKTAYAVVKGK